MPRWFSSPVAIAAVAAALIAPGLIASPLARANSTSTQTADATVSEQSQLRETLGVTFLAPQGFSEVRALSRQTRGIVYSPSGRETPDIIIRLAELESDPDSWVQFNTQEERSYAKYLLLGGNPPSEAFSQRTFFGKSLLGESQTRRSRSGYRYTEIYVLPLESGRKLAIAFDADTLVPIQTVEKAFNTVSESLKEQPSKKKKKKKRNTQAQRFR